MNCELGESSSARDFEADMLCNALKLARCIAGKHIKPVDGESSLASPVSKVPKHERFRVGSPRGMDQSRLDVPDNSLILRNFASFHS